MEENKEQGGEGKEDDEVEKDSAMDKSEAGDEEEDYESDDRVKKSTLTKGSKQTLYPNDRNSA